MIKHSSSKTFTIANYAFFIVLLLLMLYPFWYVLMFSLSNPSKVALNNYYLLPHGFTFRTYIHVLKEDLIFIGFKNSGIVTVVGTLISLFLTTCMAYPMSKRDLLGKRAIFGFVVFTMIFNGGIIPTYLVVRSLGMLDTLWALMLPMSVSVYNLLIMIKFMKNLPESLIEAAKIDGYNDIAILVRIVIPLSKAVLAAIGLFYAVLRWNEFLPGLIYITDRSKWVIQVVLKTLLDEQDILGVIVTGKDPINPENYQMVTIVLAIIPMLAIYPYLQRYFVKGIMLGAVKS